MHGNNSESILDVTQVDNESNFFERFFKILIVKPYNLCLSAKNFFFPRPEPSISALLALLTQNIKDNPQLLKEINNLVIVSLKTVATLAQDTGSEATPIKKLITILSNTDSHALELERLGISISQLKQAVNILILLLWILRFTYLCY